MSATAVAQLMNIHNKCAVVTGASQGIGRVIAQRLAEAGAKVVLHYRGDKDGAQQSVDLITQAGGQAIALKADLTDPNQVETLMKESKDHFGSVDILINNAGAFPNHGLLDMTLENWQSMYAANVETTFLCTQIAAHHMKEQSGGSIVNIASISAVSPGADHSHYNSAKAAVVSFTQSAAQELGTHNIRVNAVSPGLVYRDGLEEAWPEGVKRWNDKAPLSRVTQPLDVADACLFFSSAASRFITGQNLLIDGGVMSTSIY